ncbi:D-amino acid dehydrogenase small subunit [Thalassovita gelatinovora]|uniref:D-amino acid dehydrogenase small subunit n=1 Tax=Thalassovita gelatinovora TaxID=53501 RepID=A0A0P1F6X8_THAGE|nr:FAD-dependent oxidoreductase [Thalassovita gelatinovora]QIZ79161.1 FAD-dependent oxidoreductase [Thalassovita gelatinovora]CUH63616.1 D-amino acid dehydrogenase small subunit [Thalassovita gelatinovora]SER00549.1 D-amino-acid dehydrogenase [Thalassovita gelatinovora]
MRIGIIGAGIVGTATAGWLQRDGHEVIFFDPKEAGEACSFGNAGSLSPSAVLPVSMPGMWKKVPKWLLDPDGPLVIRSQYLPVVLPWLMRFLRHSTEAEVTRIATAMRGLLSPVFDAYTPLLQRAGAMSLMRQNGCLYVYSSREMAQKWAWGANLRRSLGVEMQELDAEELFDLEPDLRGSFGFGQFAPDNGSTPDPSALVKAIYEQAIKDGATHVRERVTGFNIRDNGVEAIQLDSNESVAVDGIVVAAGAWSGQLTRMLGTNVPLESQRGYHVTVETPGITLNRNVMAVEQNIMVNPMAMGMRLAGTVELAGLKQPPNYARAESLLTVGKTMFPNMRTEKYSTWMGHRPCMPDSMPVIGRAPKVENAWLGFGHGHVGMCGGATTGRELANLVAGRSTEIDLSAFNPERFRLGFGK